MVAMKTAKRTTQTGVLVFRSQDLQQLQMSARRGRLIVALSAWLAFLATPFGAATG
jgi:hypothetical protein